MERAQLYSGRLVSHPAGERLGAGRQALWLEGSDQHWLSGSYVPNLNSTEQWLSLVGGAAMVGVGLLRGRTSGFLMAGLGAALLYRGATRHCPVYEALGIDTSEHTPAMAVPARHGYRVEKSIIINRPADELYRFWRHLENLPRVMRHLKQVQALDSRVSRWVAEAPLGTTVEWMAEVYNERENEMIAWRSLENSEIQTAGSVHFVPVRQTGQTPQSSQTEVRVNLKYNPPAGKLGAILATLLGSGLEQQLDEDLTRFKREMEAA